MIGNYKNKKQLMVALAGYIGGSIFGPLIFFMTAGYFLDRHFGTKPKYMLIGVGIAFIISNVILIRKSREITEKMIEGREETRQEDAKSE